MQQRACPTSRRPRRESTEALAPPSASAKTAVSATAGRTEQPACQHASSTARGHASSEKNRARMRRFVGRPAVGLANLVPNLNGSTKATLPVGQTIPAGVRGPQGKQGALGSEAACKMARATPPNASTMPLWRAFRTRSRRGVLEKYRVGSRPASRLVARCLSPDKLQLRRASCRALERPAGYWLRRCRACSMRSGSRPHHRS